VVWHNARTSCNRGLGVVFEHQDEPQLPGAESNRKFRSEKIHNLSLHPAPLNERGGEICDDEDDQGQNSE